MDTFEGRSQDSVSLHKYAYAAADPVNIKDPGGRDGLVDFLAAVAIVGVLEAISAPTTGIDETRKPNYQITNDQTITSPTLGLEKSFQVVIYCKNPCGRYLVVQWVMGTYTHNGIPNLTTHQGLDDVPIAFPNWQIDSLTMEASYPVTVLGDRLLFDDLPGASSHGIAPSSGIQLNADLHFRINIYDRLKVSNAVTAFRTVDDPEPLETIPWDFQGSYVIP